MPPPRVPTFQLSHARAGAAGAPLETIVDHAPMVLFALDAGGIFTLSEGKALELLDLRPGEVVGRSVFDVYAGMPLIADAVRRALDGQHVSQLLEVGELVFDVCFSPALDRRDGGPAVIGVATDVTSRHRSQRELAHFAYHDRLTGLANRALLEERLKEAVQRAGAAAAPVALLNLDLDDFKTVNDSLGHTAGDELLCAIARRLEHRVATAHLLTRHGGDEFMLLLEDLPGDGRAVAEAVAAELLEELRLPFHVGGAALQVGASVGISLYPADALDAADLLKHADAAMYQAKRAGRGRHALYRAADDTATRRLELTGRLRTALAKGQLELHFQPVVALATGRIVGSEALVRWNDPERGMVSPAEFIPLAEDTGLIEAVGEWVLDAACRQARAWRELGLAIEVGVNVSPLELLAPGFAHGVAERMRAHGLGPGTLVIEITESALSEPAVVAPVLERIAELGVRIAIDDFGAGFSSLTRLRHLTVHILKLDRSFLAGVPQDARGAALIAAMLRLARELGLSVVAEGIETPAQLCHLRTAAAGHGQGFHLARPMAADALTELLQAGSGLGGAPS
jgi:diguanylate cyclase (GGDEF)-like protein